MAIDRTWFNNLVDDDGSGQLGTIWNKAAIKGLLDAIDGLGVYAGWTPNDGSGAALSLTVSGAWAIEIANAIVIVGFNISYPSNADGRAATIGGLPYTVGGANANAGMFGYCTVSPLPTLLPQAGTKTMQFLTPGGGNLTNGACSQKGFAGVAIYSL